jgi:DNA helicase HerA-like ATPase
LFALRMTNEKDREFVRAALPEHALALMNALPSLRPQEAVVVGEGVPVPMRLRFDDLDGASRPKSSTAAFSAAWQSEIEEEDFVQETIKRWRRQDRGTASPDGQAAPVQGAFTARRLLLTR